MRPRGDRGSVGRGANVGDAVVSPRGRSSVWSLRSEHADLRPSDGGVMISGRGDEDGDLVEDPATSD